MSPKTGRLVRFQAFIEDTTEQKARAAEDSFKTLVGAVRAVEPLSPAITTALVELKGSEPALVQATNDWLEEAAAATDALLTRLLGKSESAVSEPPTAPLVRLEELVADLSGKAAAIDASQFETMLDMAVDEKHDLEARKALTAHRPEIATEIQRLSSGAAIDAARRATDTNVITRKCTALTRSHVTALVRDQFTRDEPPGLRVVGP